jgi:hypothetical protein
MTQPDYTSYFHGLLRISLQTESDEEAAQNLQLKPNIGQILRSKRIRITAIVMIATCTLALLLYGPRRSLRSSISSINFGSLHYSSTSTSPENVDWSRYAYIQYVTNTEYLCNSVMLFEILHRLGTKADRLMMYPSSMYQDLGASTVESQLLLKAQNEYGVHLMPIEVQHRSVGDREKSFHLT